MNIRKPILYSVTIVVLAGVFYLSGPKPSAPVFDPALPAVPHDLVALEQYVQAREQQHNVKPDNEARIVWADSLKRKTSYAVVYLHGFSASQKEGDPVHRDFAKTFGCNLYLSRLSDHGIDTTDAMQLLTPDRLWNSAKEALAIGNRLGEKVILISTSTGGTLALMLAATYPEEVHALINFSPNIAINNGAAFLLNNPWGLQIARMVMKGNYRQTSSDEEKSKYWYDRYRVESLVALEDLVERTMTPETFAKVKQPSLTLYYYKNEAEQDPEVKVSAMLDMHAQLGTPDSLKMAVAVPTAGAHVIGSSLVSQDVDTVYQLTVRFAQEKLGMKPIE